MRPLEVSEPLAYCGMRDLVSRWFPSILPVKAFYNRLYGRGRAHLAASSL